ncbi:MAG: ABC transporter substrate-binding protein [Chloroflexi bacterium]|nr:ABC transporter substrate-binding protein [Chloroflexota bacterium]
MTVHRIGASTAGWLAGLTALLILSACAAPALAPGAPSTPTRAPTVAASAPASSPPVARPGLEVVKTGYLGANMSNAAIFIAAEKGYFEEQGISVELIPFDAGTRMVPALATNELQVGAGSASVGLFNSVLRNIHSKVVADKGSGPPGAGWQAMVVRKDLYDSGALTKLEDLRGRNFGVFTLGATQEAILDYHLRLVGLTLADVNVLEVPGGDQLAAFANGQLDAAWAIEPLVTIMVDRGLVVRLFGSEEHHPNDQTSVVMYSEQFAQQRDAATRWMVAYLKAARDYNDAFVANRNREEIVRILEKVGVVTDRRLLEKFAYTGINPNGYVNRESLQEMHDYFLRRGTLPQPVPLDELIDDRFVTAAIAQLGWYDSPLYRDPVWRR